MVTMMNCAHCGAPIPVDTLVCTKCKSKTNSSK